MGSQKPPKALWSCTINNHELIHTAKAGNYFAAIDNNNNLLLINAIDGMPFPAKHKPLAGGNKVYKAITLSDINNAIFMAYSEGNIVIVDSTNGKTGPFNVYVYNLNEIINNPSSITAIWSKSSIAPEGDKPVCTVSEGSLYMTYSVTSSRGSSSKKNYLVALSVNTGGSSWVHNKKKQTKAKAHHGHDGPPPLMEEAVNETITSTLKDYLSNDYTTLLLTEPGGNSADVNIGSSFCSNHEAIYTSIGNQLYAFNKAYGDRRFPRSNMVNAPSLLSISSDDPILYTEKGIVVKSWLEGLSTSTIYCLDPVYGELVWAYPKLNSSGESTSQNTWRVACLSRDRERVLIYDDSGLLQLLNTKNGKALWGSGVQMDIEAGYTITSVQAIIDVDNVQVIPQLHLIHSSPTSSISSKNLFRVNLDASKLKAVELPFIKDSDTAPANPPLLINGAVILSSSVGSGSSTDTTVSATPFKEDENAAYFNGGDNSILYTSIGNSLKLKKNDFTVECWLRTTYGGQIFESKASKGKNSLHLNISKLGLISLIITDDAGVDYLSYVLKDDQIIDGEWHHLAIAVKSGKGEYYIDGIHYPSNKLQLYNGKKYYNDDYTMTKSTYPKGKGPSHHLTQLPAGTAKPPIIPITNQKQFSIGSASELIDSKSFTGLLREFRVWNNALEADKINSRMFKILGPFQHDSKTKLDKKTNKQVPVSGNSINGKEPKLMVNVHMDKSYAVTPNKFSSSETTNTTSNVLNDVDPFSPQFGVFNLPCSTPTDLDLELKGFPYILDHDKKEWPFEEHWAVRGEHRITTNAVISNDGVICFGANNYLYGIRKHDGKGLWSIPMNEFSNPIATGIGFLVLCSEATGGGNLCLIHPKSGELQVIGAATNVLGKFYTANQVNDGNIPFQSNSLLAADGTHILYARDDNYIGLVSDLETHSKLALTAGYTSVENLQIIGNNAFWCEYNGSSYVLRGYDLEKSMLLFDAIIVDAPIYTANNQHLYYIASATLKAVKLPKQPITETTATLKAISSMILSSLNTSLSSTSLSGMALSPSGNQLILTQNGDASTKGSIFALRPATLSQCWEQPVKALHQNVNAPTIGTDGRNVYCTTKADGSSDSNGGVMVIALNNGDVRGSYTVSNPILSPALVDHGTVYFACADNIMPAISANQPATNIDGALHQVVFGDTNVLALNGSSHYEITNSTTSTEQTACWQWLNPSNACIETWVNLEQPPKGTAFTSAGIISLSTGYKPSADETKYGLHLEMQVAADRSVEFCGYCIDSANTVQKIQFKSNSHAIELGQWCHIAVNLSTDSSKPAIQLFINGKTKPFTKGTLASTPCPTSYTTYIGATGSLSGTAANQTNGLIGMVRIWNAYQTASQIMDRMHTQLIGTEENLMADWSFNRLNLEDVAENATSINGFEITPIPTPTTNGNTNSNSYPRFILNELNFDKPNYPYLTYKGEKDPRISNATYDGYKLIINAHKADGSPINLQNIDVWYAEGEASEVYVTNVPDTALPTTFTKGDGWHKISKENGLSNQKVPVSPAQLKSPNGITLQTNENGQAILWVVTTDKTSGPGFDLFADIIPKHERFHVNTLIDRQELKVVPPPTIKAQGELIQSYHHSAGGKIDASRQKGVYSTILKIEGADKTPLVNQMVMAYTDIPQTIRVGGQVYDVTSKNGAVLFTNALGEITVEADATDTKGFVLEVWASYMHKGERTKYAVSEAAHQRLANIHHEDLTSSYVTSWTGSKANTSKSLLPSQYSGSSKKVAQSFRHLMAAGNAKKATNAAINKAPQPTNGNGNQPPQESFSDTIEKVDTVTSPTDYVSPTAKPKMQQPLGSPKPDLLSSIRTLSYINRTKTLDMQVFKESVLGAAASLTGSEKPSGSVQGIKIGFIKGAKKTSGNHGGHNGPPPLTLATGSDGSQVTLEYLDANGLIAAKKGKKVHHSGLMGSLEEGAEGFLDKLKGDAEHIESGIADWLGTDLISDIESAAEEAAHAFEDLLKEAEAMVLDFTSDIETAITSVLNDLGPIGHLLADGVEKVMAVVDKVIHFVDVLINTMIEFLMLLYEWKHILGTQNLLLDIINPGFTHLNSLITNQAYITDLKTDLGKLSFSPPPNGSTNSLQTSVGEIKNKHQEGYGNQAHSVKSKALLHKAHSNAHHVRTTPPSKKYKPKSHSGSQPSTSVTELSSNAFSLLEGIDLSGSLDPFTEIFESIKTTIDNNASDGKSGIDVLLDALEVPLDVVLPEELLQFIIGKPSGNIDTGGVINLAIEIPFLSALFEFIDGHHLTFKNLIALVAAVPVVVVYEALEEGKFFDVDFNTADMPTTYSLSSSTGNNALTAPTGNAPTPPTHGRIKSAGILFTVISELQVVCELVADYAVYYDLQNGGDKQTASKSPVKVFFKTMSGFCALMITGCNYRIANNIHIALEIDSYYNPSNTTLASYKKSLIEYAGPFFALSCLTSAYDILAVEYYFQKEIEKLSDWAVSTFAPFAIVIGSQILVFMIYSEANESDSVGTSNDYQKNLKTRVNLYIASNMIANVCTGLSLMKGKLAKQTMADEYMAFAGARQAVKEASIICKAVGELKYGSQQLNYPST